MTKKKLLMILAAVIATLTTVYKFLDTPDAPAPAPAPTTQRAPDAGH